MCAHICHKLREELNILKLEFKGFINTNIFKLDFFKTQNYTIHHFSCSFRTLSLENHALYAEEKPFSMTASPNKWEHFISALWLVPMKFVLHRNRLNTQNIMVTHCQ